MVVIILRISTSAVDDSTCEEECRVAGSTLSGEEILDVRSYLRASIKSLKLQLLAQLADSNSLPTFRLTDDTYLDAYDEHWTTLQDIS